MREGPRRSVYVLQGDAVDAPPPSTACRDTVPAQEEDKIALDDPDFWEKTLGKDALKQKKEIVDTTQRKAKQGDKEYVHNYGPVDRVKKRQRDADYYEDVPEDKKEQHPYDWGKTQARELWLVLPKRPIGMDPSRFVWATVLWKGGRNRRMPSVRRTTPSRPTVAPWLGKGTTSLKNGVIDT